ncbi:flippase [Shewanella sp. 10N.286.45.A1]|uniref:flippase n=1 Tax=Shewanella sp. 10N.286.45.A1 TaxID=3229694 RepID=UPI00354EBD53
MGLGSKFFGTAGIMLLNRGLILIAGIVFARYLGPENYGLYSFVLGVITIATLPAIAGVSTLIVRQIAYYQLENKFSLLLGIINWSRFYVLAVSLLMFIIMLFLLYFRVFDDSVTSLLWGAIFLIPIKGLLIQQSSILNGFRQPVKSQTPIQIIVPATTLLTLIPFFLLEFKIDGGLLIRILLFSTVLALIFSTVFVREAKKGVINSTNPEYEAKKWNSALLPFMMITLVATLNTELVSVLLGFIDSSESVAYFKVAMQAVSFIALSVTSINIVIMPDVARLFKSGDKERTQLLLTKSVRLIAAISLPIIIALILFGEIAIGFLFGDEYLEAYPILVVLCIGQLANVLMGSVGLVMSMTGKEKQSLKLLSFTLILNVILFSILVPKFGAFGAAISVSVSVIILNVLMAQAIYRSEKLITWIR